MPADILLSIKILHATGLTCLKVLRKFNQFMTDEFSWNQFFTFLTIVQRRLYFFEILFYFWWQLVKKTGCFKQILNDI